MSEMVPAILLYPGLPSGQDRREELLQDVLL